MRDQTLRDQRSNRLNALVPANQGRATNKGFWPADDSNTESDENSM
jgi:hypothetical protein